MSTVPEADRWTDDGDAVELTIGDFARASGLTPKALRLYDETGLLVPARVDDVTGYRHYRTDQLGRARLVARLRLAGMPLARIRTVADLPPRAAAAELTSYGRQVEADSASARALLADLVSEITGSEHDMNLAISETADLRAAARSGIGTRTTQEDATLVRGPLCAVADGVGGVAGVSRTALDAIGVPPPGEDPVTFLDAALAAAAQSVAAAYPDDPEAASTLTAVLLLTGRAVSVHVGDSRLYQVRDGSLTRLTRDHTVVQTLVDEGRLTTEEARTDERRVVLNRAVAAGAPYAPDLAVHATEPGDRFVLTSDGVHARLDPAALAALLTAPGSPDDVADAVAAAVEAAGPDDNWAVLVVDVA